jgi:glutathione-regulated potassium-efflux system ancillary protein KefG
MAPPDTRVLLLFVHPALERSRINRVLLESARGVEGVTVHDLYEAYPDFHIDVPREQALLEGHDVILLQHPLYWYSTPALAKEWQDIVLEHGWAYGSAGNALRGKRLVTVVSTGGPLEAYRTGSEDRFSLRQLLAPLEQTARLCGMRYGPPFAVHGTHLMTPEAIEAHGSDYARFLAAVQQGRLAWERADALDRLNQDLEAIIAPTEGN